jgi:hypothetical protein
MTHYSPENAQRVLDFIVEHGSIPSAAKSIGASSKLVYIWITQSSEDEKIGVVDSRFIVSWPTEEKQFFHKAALLARRMNAMNYESTLRQQVNEGFQRKLFDSAGKPLWRCDPKIAADALEMDDFEWEITHGRRARSDVFMRDADGALIQETVFDVPASALRIHAARSILGGAWNPSTEVNQTTKISGGVLVVGARAERPATPLVHDMEARLAEIRANGPQNPKPDRPVEIGGRADDPADDKPRAALPPPRLVDHPRAHRAEQPLPPPAKEAPPSPPPASYARPDNRLDRGEGIGRGAVPPGGFKVR